MQQQPMRHTNALEICTSFSSESNMRQSTIFPLHSITNIFWNFNRLSLSFTWQPPLFDVVNFAFTFEKKEDYWGLYPMHVVRCTIVRTYTYFANCMPPNEKPIDKNMFKLQIRHTFWAFSLEIIQTLSMFRLFMRANVQLYM